MREIELIDKRKAREKHFLQEDGTIVAKVYSDDIHYLKNGKYQEIDNTLKKENDYYINKSNDYKVKFKENGKDSLMQIMKDDHYIDIKLKNANNTKARKKKSISKLVEDVAYENVLDNINIEYKALPTKIKETIVLQNSEQTEFTFTVDTNLVLEKNDTCILAKKDGKTIFTIDSPYMEDSKGEMNHNVDYNLRQVSNGYELDLVLDKEWLNLETTQYPVYVDPTITNQNQSGGMQDTYIYPGDTGVDRNGDSFLVAGVEKIYTTTGTVDRINRTLIKFDLPIIGTGSEIINANITLVGYFGNYSERLPLASIHRVTSPWDETSVNWNEMYNKYDNKVEALMECPRSGCDDNNNLIAYYTGAGITHLVKKWYKDTPNYGVLIKSVKEVSGDNDVIPKFFSKENMLQGDSPKPLLTITYRNQNGLESYLNYKQQQFVNGSTYINTFNGNLVGVFDIANTIGGPMPASLQLIYNTNDVVLNNNIGCGIGCRFNLNQSIKNVKISSEDYLEYVDEDGTIHYFTRDVIKNDGVFYDEDGLGLIIEKNDSTCVMKDKNNNIMMFTKDNNIYYLTKIEDIDHNIISILLDENHRISKVIDKNNSEISIQYGFDVIKVISPEGTIDINYDDGKLISIKKLGETTIFSYNEKQIISRITDINGMSFVYEYYDKTPYKMKKVIQYGINNIEGQSFTLEYGFNSTSIIDYKGEYETVIFNDNGNVLSKNSLYSDENINDAYSLTQNYGYLPNKLISQSIPVRYVKNYLKNTSFENEKKYFSIEDGAIEKILMEFSNDCSYSGDRSLKIISKMAGQSVRYKVDVPKGKYYTFSGYFKGFEDAILTLYYESENGVKISQQIIEYSKDFERQDVTIYYEEEANTELIIEISFPEIGVLYVDDIQLEEGEIANNYNFIENSDFSEGFSDWKLEAYNENSSKVDATSFFECVSINNNKNTALKVSMNPLYSTSFSKRFNIKGKIGEVFTLSFWYKNEGVEPCRQYSGNHVTVIFHPKDENQPGHCITPSENFNANDDKWQYCSYRGRSLEDFDYIDVIFSQDTEANNFYITNLSFYKNITSGDYEYDNDGNLISIKNQTGEVNIFKYDFKNQLISTTMPKGKKFKYEYDNTKKERVLSAITSNGITNEIEYDTHGNPITTQISKKYGKIIQNGEYRIRSKGTKKYLKAELYSVLLESNPCSNSVWKIEKQDDSYKFMHAIILGNSIAYYNNTLILTKANTNNLFTLESNDNGSYCIRVQAGDSFKYLKANGPLLEFGNYIEEDSSSYEFYFEFVDELFEENSATYDENGKFLTSVTNSNLNKTIYEVDKKTGLIMSMTNPNHQKSFYTYNDKKQLSKIQLGDMVVFYDYNNSNLLNKIIIGSKEYNFFYDSFLNLKKIMLGNSIVFIDNEYEEKNGNLLSQTYGNNQKISYEYDDFSRIKVTHKMDDNYCYKYDNNGNLSKIVSDNHIEKYTFDIADRVNTYQNDNLKVRYTYDSHNNVIQKQYNLNKVHDLIITSIHVKNIIKNNFDDNDFLTSIELDNNKINYQYDNLGRILNKNINNQYTITYNYISNGNRTTELLKNIKNGNDDFSYSYDKLNNITHIYFNNELIKYYEYDLYNELIKEENYDTSKKVKYAYDNFGNLLSKTVTYINDTDTNETVHTYQYQNFDWPDQLTKFDDKEIVYDQIGNPIKIGNDISMTWINGKSLNSYIDCDKNLTIRYEYNRDGVRTKKIINGIETDYYLENNNVVYEKRGDFLFHYLYDLTGIAGVEYNGNVYYYIKNIQNDIIGILNSNYERIVNYEYDSWGKVLSIKDQDGNDIVDNSHIGIVNPFRYREYYYDTETELYYLNNRYYTPEWGRFLNADGTIGANRDLISYNLYAYVSNNPIMHSDPTGQGIFSALSKVCKTVKKAAKSVISIDIKKSAPYTLPSGKQLNKRSGNIIASSETGINKIETKHVGGDDPAWLVINKGQHGILDSTVGFDTKLSEGRITFNFGLLKSSFTYTDQNNTSFEFGREGLNTFLRGSEVRTIGDEELEAFAKVSINSLVLDAVAVGLAVFIVDGAAVIFSNAQGVMGSFGKVIDVIGKTPAFAY